jgi:23S rRNA (adenine2503-C2)-methyltransferase
MEKEQTEVNRDSEEAQKETQKPVKKKVLKGLTLQELKDYFTGNGEQRFRGEQFFNWMYNHLVTDIDEMSNIPKVLRNKFRDLVEFKTLDYVDSIASPVTGTKKYIFQTKEKLKLETVVIPEVRRTTLCVSTQVGCPLDCKFCATGLMGYKRNLSSGEIFDQYMLAAKDYGVDKITNVVFMGMGEPLLNYGSTLKALQIFSEELSTGINLSKVTVSTAGIAPKIRELADTNLKAKIALSLHSCSEETRSKLMPINDKYPLRDNINALKYYAFKTGTRITFEYIMLKNINDKDEDIIALSRLCSEIPSKINIIPFNSLRHMNPSGFAKELESTPRHRIDDFVWKLRYKNLTVMVRDTQGDDIAAACGQLAIKY